jgi:hypothetical protein
MVDAFVPFSSITPSVLKNKYLNPMAVPTVKLSETVALPVKSIAEAPPGVT